VPNQEGREEGLDEGLDEGCEEGRDEGLDKGRETAAARVKRRVALCDCVRERARERRRRNCDGLRFTVTRFGFLYALRRRVKWTILLYRRIYSTPNVASRILPEPKLVVTTSTIRESDIVIVADLLFTITV
jgi:hypothetical protein